MVRCASSEAVRAGRGDSFGVLWGLGCYLGPPSGAVKGAEESGLVDLQHTKGTRGRAIGNTGYVGGASGHFEIINHACRYLHIACGCCHACRAELNPAIPRS